MSDRQSPKDRKRQTLLTAARGIARHLGEGWSFQTPSPGWSGCVLYLDGPDDKSLQIYQLFDGTTVDLCGQLPSLPSGKSVFLFREDRERCRMRASLKRTPADLARDISQRLLPAYEEVFEMARRQVEEVQAREESASQLLEELSSLCEVEQQIDREVQEHTVLLSDCQSSIQVIGRTPNEPTKAKLVLHLPPAVAREVLELVTTRCPEMAARS